MNKLSRNGGIKGKRQPAWRRVPIILCLIMVLTACNYPRATALAPKVSDRRLTERAGILNPDLDGDIETTSLPQNLPTPTQLAPTANPENTPWPAMNGFVFYSTEQGDTLPAIAERFDVPQESIVSETSLSGAGGGFLPVGSQLQIPNVLDDLLPYTSLILPDSEVIYGPSVGEFDAAAYAYAADGFLATYSELVKGELLLGPDIVQWVALETSTNPRLLLAFLEYQSGWVTGHPVNAANDRYPIGFGAVADYGLYKELMISARLLAQGFYGWRDGSQVDLDFYGGGTGRLSPYLNSGSAALLRLFAALYPREVVEPHLIDPAAFLSFYEGMFGDYWGRAAAVEPYLLTTTYQPDLALPFAPLEAWSLTGGPHITWQTGTPLGAIDFAPITGEAACAVSIRWVTASAPGRVARSARGVVALDLDGDGDEGTGWVLIYMHIAEKDRVEAGLDIELDDRIGHPSCEGGQSSGTHVHLARKFNGEWMGVGEPMPFTLSGWHVVAGERRYEGYLQKGDSIVTSRPNGSAGSTIIRDE